MESGSARRQGLTPTSNGVITRAPCQVLNIKSILRKKKLIELDFFKGTK